MVYSLGRPFMCQNWIVYDLWLLEFELCTIVASGWRQFWRIQIRQMDIIHVSIISIWLPKRCNFMSRKMSSYNVQSKMQTMIHMTTSVKMTKPKCIQKFIEIYSCIFIIIITVLLLLKEFVSLGGALTSSKQTANRFIEYTIIYVESHYN